MNQKIKLYCLPHAGGSATLYIRWKKQLASSIELCPLELAGRGKRFMEPFYNSFDDAVNDVYHLIKPGLDKHAYAIWGHSMGCLMAFELMRRIKQEGLNGPVHAFFSGRNPPHIKKDEKSLHTLPDEEFKKEVYKLGGIADEILENKELSDLFIPILKADYRILEGYTHEGENTEFDCDISVLNGKEDMDVSPEEIRQWQMYTKKTCSFYEFGGGHFYINDYDDEVIDIINSKLG